MSQDNPISPEDAASALFAPDYIADPAAVFARLRAHTPVQRILQPDGQSFWLVMDYDDVQTVLRDQRFAINPIRYSDPERLARIPKPLRREEGILSHDGAKHARLRALVSKAFTPRYVEALRPRIEQLTDELLDAVVPRGHMDLIDEFAFPLPMTVILEVLGIPFEDRDLCRVGSDALARNQGRTAEEIEPAELEQVDAFIAYVDALIERKRARPAPDLLSELIAAEERDDRLSPAELQALALVLIVAGHETTVGLIGLGALELLRRPERLAELRAQPELLPAAVEELLRFTSVASVPMMRFATEDVELGGAHIRAGEAVMPAIGAANRDAAQFAAPAELRFDREGGRHLAFGHGIHFCVGAPLARLEAQTAIGALLRRLPGLRLSPAPDALVWRPGWGLRGLRRLLVEF